MEIERFSVSQAIRQSVARPDSAEISPEEIKASYYKFEKEEGDALRFAAQRIMAFHERQRTKTWMYQDGAATLGQVVTPLDAVGVYVPGGKAVYPSTVLMSAIPARVAGVKRIVMCTPPQKGEINPYLLVAADIAGVTEIYRVGGVQAIGALAFGTKTISKWTRSSGRGTSMLRRRNACCTGLSALIWWRDRASC